MSSTDSKNKGFRKTLLHLIQGKGAHADFDTVIRGVPAEHYGMGVEGLPYTLWELLEHIRLTQRDILDYIQDPEYTSPEWPEGYWPNEKEPTSLSAWRTSVKHFREDSEEVQKIIRSSKTDLLAQIPHGEPGHTILREVLLIADHTAYHLGQMVALRRQLGSWIV